METRTQLFLADLGVTYVKFADRSRWLQTEIALFTWRLRAGKVIPCPHLAPGHPSSHALWASKRLLCGGCTPMRELLSHTTSRCDRCRRVTAMSELHIHTTATGMTLVVYRACLRCHEIELVR